MGGDYLGEVSDLYSYDGSGQWTKRAAMPTARKNLGASASLDGRIFAIGGEQSGQFETDALDVVEAYNPSTNSWATMSPLPAARTQVVAVTGKDGRIYAICGSDGTNCASDVYAYWS